MDRRIPFFFTESSGRQAPYLSQSPAKIGHVESDDPRPVHPRVSSASHNISQHAEWTIYMTVFHRPDGDVVIYP
jgi:hypothetical protein